MSPWAIMCGERLGQENHLCLMFGEYCQVYKDELTRNSNKPRTLGSVSLGPTYNKQGGFKFMSLTTGAVVTRHGWDPIPMPSSMIERVNRLGKDQPELLLFTDRKGRLIGEAEPTGVDGAEQPGQTKTWRTMLALTTKEPKMKNIWPKKSILQTKCSPKGQMEIK